ncbi:MAG: hypothetical protein ACYTDY_06205, partial [Planctomycetota bacterium]
MSPHVDVRAQGVQDGLFHENDVSGGAEEHGPVPRVDLGLVAGVPPEQQVAAEDPDVDRAVLGVQVAVPEDLELRARSDRESSPGGVEVGVVSDLDAAAEG